MTSGQKQVHEFAQYMVQHPAQASDLAEEAGEADGFAGAADRLQFWPMRSTSQDLVVSTRVLRGFDLPRMTTSSDLAAAAVVTNSNLDKQTFFPMKLGFAMDIDAEL